MTEQSGRATASPVPELSGGAHFPCLDAYRGIGMIMVLLAHASFATGYSTRGALAPYLSRMELAVPMFFVLSGFLLYRPYALATLGTRRRTGPRRFLRRRALRIFPGYWFALLGIVLLFGTGVLTDLWAWIANLFLLQQFTIEEPFRITQAWSIGVEISFYLVLPLIGAALDRVLEDREPERRVEGLYGAMLALYLAGTAFRVFVVVTEPGWQDDSRFWLPMYLDFFAIGMALAVTSAAAQQGHPTPRPLARLSEHPALCWVAALIIFLLVAQMDPPDEPFGLNGAEYLPRQFAYGIASILWLAPAMFGDQRRGRLRAFLRSRVMSYLGAISLSFYLWHLELIELAKRLTVPDYAARAARAEAPIGDWDALATITGNVLVVSLLAFALTFVVAAFAHRFVEVPFLRLKDKPLRQLPAVYRSSVSLRRP